MPGVGLLKSGVEFLGGYDFVGGRYLSTSERIGAGVSLAAGAAFSMGGGAGGSVVRTSVRTEIKVATRSAPIVERYAAKTLPGPTLPAKIADTFTDSAYVNRQLAEDTSFFKYHGVDNRTGRKFSWVFDQKYAFEEELRSALAIRRDWGVNITHVSEFNVPKGTWVSEGTAAAQGAGYPGGAYQGVIQNVPRSWVIRTDKAFR